MSVSGDLKSRSMSKLEALRVDFLSIFLLFHCFKNSLWISHTRLGSWIWSDWNRHEVSQSQAPGNCRSPSARHCSSPLFTEAKNSRLTSVRCWRSLCQLAFLWSTTSWSFLPNQGSLGSLGKQSIKQNDTMTKVSQGADDVQGALNHITNETILAAGDEIKLGRAVNLK